MAHMMSGSLKTDKEPLGGNFAGKEHLGGNFSGQVRVGIQGPPGKTAYEYAKEGGYTGTEEEFAKDLADAASGYDVELDTTLTQSGKAADAKAVGDALDHIETTKAEALTNNEIKNILGW